jgi:hypothetical protein
MHNRTARSDQDPAGKTRKYNFTIGGILWLLAVALILVTLPFLKAQNTLQEELAACNLPRPTLTSSMVLLILCLLAAGVGALFCWKPENAKDGEQEARIAANFLIICVWIVGVCLLTAYFIPLFA